MYICIFKLKGLNWRIISIIINYDERLEVPLGSSKPRQEKSGKFFVAKIYHTPSYDNSTYSNEL